MQPRPPIKKKSWKPGNMLSPVPAVQVSSELIDARGKLCLEKAGLIAYVHGEYFSLGRDLGHFGFSIRKKPQKKGPGNGRKPRR